MIKLNEEPITVSFDVFKDETQTQYCHMLVKAEGKHYRYLYKIHNDIVKYGYKNAKRKNTRNIKNHEEVSAIFEELEKGTLIICTTSRDGVIMLSKHKSECKTYDNVIDLISFMKTIDETGKFKKQWIDRDIIFYNIKQLSTGLDFKILNAGIIFDECNETDFIQWLFRSGRLADGKLMNYIYIPAFIISPEKVTEYSDIIERKLHCRGAIQGFPSESNNGYNSGTQGTLPIINSTFVDKCTIQLFVDHLNKDDGLNIDSKNHHAVLEAIMKKYGREKIITELELAVKQEFANKTLTIEERKKISFNIQEKIIKKYSAVYLDDFDKNRTNNCH